MLFTYLHFSVYSMTIYDILWSSMHSMPCFVSCFSVYPLMAGDSPQGGIRHPRMLCSSHTGGGCQVQGARWSAHGMGGIRRLCLGWCRWKLKKQGGVKIGYTLGIPHHHVSPANGNMNGENEWTWWFRIGFRGTLFSGRFKYTIIYGGNLNFRCVIWVEIADAQLLVSAGLPKSIQVSTAATALRLWCRRATVGDDQSRGDCRGVRPASPDAIHSEDVAGSAMAYKMASHALYCCVILKVVTAAKDVYHDYQD